MSHSRRLTTTAAFCMMFTGFIWAATPGHAAPKKARAKPSQTSVLLPGGTGGIGFDDLMYSPRLGKVIVPAGRTGDLDLLSPSKGTVSPIPGFSKAAPESRGHGESVTSVSEDQGYLFATDRTSKTVNVVDPAAKKIVARAKLAGGPDYVRYVASTHELWVTEPRQERIEIFKLTGGKVPTPVHEAFIEVPGGPESLVLDPARGRAYTNLWKDETIAIDVAGRKIAARWPNGCKGSRGLALDAKDGFLFVGCAEGGTSVLDAAHGGKILDHVKAGSGVDIIAYSPALRHLYVPGARSATLTVFGVCKSGKLERLGTVPTARGAHGAAAGAGRVFVPVPSSGKVLVIADRYRSFSR